MLIIAGSLPFTLWSCTRSPQKSEKLTVAYVPSIPMALLYIAEEEGYFKDEGLEVKYNTFNSGKDALNSRMGSSLLLTHPAKIK